MSFRHNDDAPPVDVLAPASDEARAAARIEMERLLAELEASPGYKQWLARRRPLRIGGQR